MPGQRTLRAGEGGIRAGESTIRAGHGAKLISNILKLRTVGGERHGLVLFLLCS